MRTKKKVSVTIDAEIFEDIAKAAESCKMAKSQLAQEAFKLWLKKRTEESMAVGYAEMAAEDIEFANTALHAQKETLS